jgi:hypothetical protein
MTAAKVCLRRYHDAFPPLHEAEAGEDEIVEGIKNDDYLYGYHDDIQDDVPYTTLPNDSVRSCDVHGRIDQTRR